MVIFFRTIVLYLIVIIVMRIMGKRQIGELQPYELVVAIMISELASVPMQNTGIPLLSGIIPILTLLAMQIIISIILFGNNRARRIISGTPVKVIEEGRIIEKNLKKEIFTLSDLLEALRIAGYSDLSEIREAILEKSGQLSVYGYDSLPVPVNLIVDGKFIRSNLQTAGVSEQEVYTRIAKFGAADTSQVLLCCIFEGKKWYVQLKEGK